MRNDVKDGHGSPLKDLRLSPIDQQLIYLMELYTEELAVLMQEVVDFELRKSYQGAV